MKKLAFILLFLFSAYQVSMLILSYSPDSRASLAFSVDDQKNFDKSDMKKDVDKHQSPSGQCADFNTGTGKTFSFPAFLYPAYYPDPSTPPPDCC